MNKFKRNERIGAMVKILTDSPNKIFTLSFFTEMFNSAKSTISEDLVIVKTMMEELSLGRVVTIAGAAGGVKYLPLINEEKRIDVQKSLCELMNDTKRRIPGAYLYMADILYDPRITKDVGEIFAASYADAHIDYVMTIETKGIPVAMMTARSLNVPLVIARHENKISEGPTLSINYVSGSTGKILSMYIAKKAVKANSNVLIIDDFMKAGGTAKGMCDLVEELDSKVAGVCVISATGNPEGKMVADYMNLLNLDKDESGCYIATPNFNY